MIDDKKIEKLTVKLFKQYQWKNCPKALRLADKILKIYPEDSDTLKVKLNASFYLKKYEIALETSEKIIKAYPDFHAANAFRSDILTEIRGFKSIEKVWWSNENN